MSDLPDYTVVKVSGAVFVKVDGVWYQWNDSGWAFQDDRDLWRFYPDAVVVALPTALALNRHQAEVLWDMKQKARTCDRT